MDPSQNTASTTANHNTMAHAGNNANGENTNLSPVNNTIDEPETSPPFTSSAEDTSAMDTVSQTAATGDLLQAPGGETSDLVPVDSQQVVGPHPYPEGAQLHRLAMDGPHPATAEIIRQVEFYFSDENLPHDAHLLSFAGVTGDGWVSINRIFGFKKMRSFLPKAKAKQALRESTFLEVDAKLKYVRRRVPLATPVQVSPKSSDESKTAKILIEKPWLSKAMLKPTGFEEGFTEGPLKPEEHEINRKLFDPEEAFTIRIDYAVARYLSKRKMHQDTRHIFSKFLLFGGFDGSQRQFTGGFDEKDLEDYSKDEILQMKAAFAVSDRVLDGLDPDQEAGSTWVVDFENMAKAFFSSHLLQHFAWLDEKVTDTATNVIQNFFNYLLLHDVCPEHKEDLLNARKVCILAQQELPKLAAAHGGLPGDFNRACSTLFGGNEAQRRPFNPNADWVNKEDDMGLSDQDATFIWHTALAAHCTSEQFEQIRQADADGSLTSVNEHETGLEVIEVQFAIDPAKGIYNSEGIKDTFIRPTGKLICKRWNSPGTQTFDLPKEVLTARKANMSKRYEFLVEEDVLRSCYTGLKLQATVMQFSAGDISYLDCVHLVYPSFYTWTLNENVRDFKSSGEPKEWMKRQNEKHRLGSSSSLEQVKDDGTGIVDNADEDHGGQEQGDEVDGADETPD